MTETNVFQLAQPGTFTDSLTEVLRNGARALLGQGESALNGCCGDFRKLIRQAIVELNEVIAQRERVERSCSGTID